MGSLVIKNSATHLVAGLVAIASIASGCGASRRIPDIIKNTTSSGTVGLTTTGWSGAGAIDSSVNGLSNWVWSPDGTDAPYCVNSAEGAGYSVSGCVQQPPIVYSGRWFVGYPQSASAAIPAADYDFVNMMSSIANATTLAFGGFGSGLGFLSAPLGVVSQVARNVSYATLTNGKVVAVYWVYRSDFGGGSSEVYANVYNPTTGTWGAMTKLSTGAAGTATWVENATYDVAWENYSGGTTHGNAGNHCRPQVAASGNTAMAVWCERDAVDTSFVSYVRYARFDGTSWLSNNSGEGSSPILAGSDSAVTGMNSNTLHERLMPGMVRRVAVPAWVPQSLFVTTADEVIQFSSSAQGSAGTTLSAFDLWPAVDGAGAHTVAAGGTTIISGLEGTTSVAVSSTGTVDGLPMLMVASQDTSAATSKRLKIWVPSPVENIVAGNGANGTAGVVEICEGGSAGCTGAGNDFVPSAVATCGGRLIVSDSAADTNTEADIYIWNSIPTDTGTPIDISTASVTLRDTAADANIITALHCDGTKLYAIRDRGVLADLLIFNTIPATSYAADFATAADVAITDLNGGNAMGVFSDGKRLMVSSEAAQSIYIWHYIPTTGFSMAPVPAAAAGGPQVVLTNATAGVNAPSAITSDGLRLYVADRNDNEIKIWTEVPFEDRLPDVTITGVNAPTGVSVSRTVPTDWPASSTLAVNPGTTDTLRFTFRNTTFTVSSLVGDSLAFNRCTAISNIVNTLNANSSFSGLGLRASLPRDWNGPECDDTYSGLAQYFYVSYNEAADPARSVDLDSTASGEWTTSADADPGTTGALRPEDLRILTGNVNENTRFFDVGNANDDGTYGELVYSLHPSATNVTTGGIVSVPKINKTHFFRGRLSGDKLDSGTMTSLNGTPVLNPNASAIDPAAEEGGNLQTVDHRAASFVSIAGLGSGAFSVVQAARSWVQSVGKMMDATTSTTSPSTLIASEYSLPRTLFGYVFRSGDWLRRHTVSTSVPQPFFVGPQEPYAVQYSDGTPQRFPLGARWPRFVSSGSGKGLVLFYARAGQRPYLNLSQSSYGTNGTYETPAQIGVANALWMATYDDASGFSAAAPVSPNTTSDREDPASLNTDLEVCETVVPFAAASANTALGTASSACLVGADTYRDAPGNTVNDQYGYSHDVPPIPAAMNSDGYAAVGFHREDTGSGSDQRIGFYVALYGPETGLGSFTQIDNGTGFTMGGALAIDASGNVAAVWEERSLITRTSRSCTGGTSGEVAENHIYFRLYTASTGTWGDLTQIDSSTITCYGNVDFAAPNYWPQAPMMPNVAFNPNGRMLVTWSGPYCNDGSSSSCRRRQQVNQYAPN